MRGFLNMPLKRAARRQSALVLLGTDNGLRAGIAQREGRCQIVRARIDRTGADRAGQFRG